MARHVSITHNGVFASGKSKYTLTPFGEVVDGEISYTEYVIKAWVYDSVGLAYLGGGTVTGPDDRDRNIALILNDHPDDDIRITVSVVHRVSRDGGRFRLDTKEEE